MPANYDTPLAYISSGVSCLLVCVQLFYPLSLCFTHGYLTLDPEPQDLSSCTARVQQSWRAMPSAVHVVGSLCNSRSEGAQISGGSDLWGAIKAGSEVSKFTMSIQFWKQATPMLVTAANGCSGVPLGSCLACAQRIMLLPAHQICQTCWTQVLCRFSLYQYSSADPS